MGRAIPPGVLRLGTSGYVYQHWKKVFYPEGLPASRWLEYYARFFDTVELNGTFYRLPPVGAAARWRDTVDDKFLFACKGSRFLTHMKRMKDAALGIGRYYERIWALRPKLGPILWQLPPNYRNPDPARLDAFLAAQPPGTRHAFEVRHAAWYTEEVCEVLDRHRAAFCEHDLLPVPPPRVTGGWRYLRFHGAKGKYFGRYGKRKLAPRADDLRRWLGSGGDAFVYFNNDGGGAALADARDLSELLGRPLPIPLLLPPAAAHPFRPGGARVKFR